MMTPESKGRAWADLFVAEARWQGERFSVTTRALLYVEAGLPVERVCDALKISRATWYRRVREHEAERAANLAAADAARPDVSQ
jgi:hypothetical protein